MTEIYGKFEYNNNDYAFAYKDYVITIVSAGYEYEEELCNKECDDVLLGVTKDNNWIMFFGCEFHRSAFLKIATHITTQGYIVFDCQDKPDMNKFAKRISFYSPAINDFYPPQTAIDNTRSDDISKFSVKLKNINDCIRKIKIDNYELIFGFYYINKYNFQSNDLLNCIPYIAFCFNEAVGIKELKECYSKLINFLSFINFNRNIPIDKIKVTNEENRKIISSGICHINSRSKNYESKRNKIILADFFEDDELASLFKQVSDNTDIRKRYYIPSKAKDIHRFDHRDLLLCATCFENVFKECYPNFKVNKNRDFNKVKSDYLTFANDYLSYPNITKKQKYYAQKFYDLINNYDGRLEEIFNSAFKEHKYELSDFENVLKSQLNISTENYGRLYADIRNHFAHGEFFKLGDDESFIYELLHGLLYAMNLKAASISGEKSKEIINKIFS